MDALITFVASVPIAVTLLVWSDVGAIQEGINERKHEANISGYTGVTTTRFTTKSGRRIDVDSHRRRLAHDRILVLVIRAGFRYS